MTFCPRGPPTAGLAPEQAQAAAPDPRHDVFALGRMVAWALGEEGLAAAPAPPDRRLVLGLSVGVAVLLIALLGVVFGGADEGDRAARLYLAEAEVLLDEGRTEQALDMLQNAEEAGAKDPEVVVAISRLRSRLNPGQN